MWQGWCQSNAYYAMPDAYCPEDRCTINTMRPFRVIHTQNGSRVNTKFVQDGNMLILIRVMTLYTIYISEMDNQAFEGSVFTASLWGKNNFYIIKNKLWFIKIIIITGESIDMGWLDGMTGCTGSCIMSENSVSFSDFAWK